jgi:acetyl esterase/lipase
MVDYRNYPVGTVPKQVQDVDSALAWTKRNIHRYGGDPNKILLTGESAGGHLGAILLLQKAFVAAEAMDKGSNAQSGDKNATFELSDCKGFVSVSAPFDLSLTDTYERHGLDRDALQRIFGGSMRKYDPLEIVLQVDPQPTLFVDNIDGTSSAATSGQKTRSTLQRLPPMLICHGALDTTVPLGGSQAFAQALRERNVRVEHRTYAGWTHTRANVEGPMDGDYRFHRHVWEAVQAWTNNNATMANSEHHHHGRAGVVAMRDVDEDATWNALGRLCPSVLVKLGSLCMPV